MAEKQMRKKRMWGIFTASGAMTGFKPRFHKAEAQAIVDNSNYEHPGNPPLQCLPVTVSWLTPAKRKGKRK